MGKVRRHIKEIASFQRVHFASQGELALTREDLHQGMLGGCVLGQFLPFRETKEHRPQRLGAQNRATDNSIRGELGFFWQRDYVFAAGLNQRSFIHALKLELERPERFDAGQRITKTP